LVATRLRKSGRIIPRSLLQLLPPRLIELLPRRDARIAKALPCAAAIRRGLIPRGRIRTHILAIVFNRPARRVLSPETALHSRRAIARRRTLSRITEAAPAISRVLRCARFPTRLHLLRTNARRHRAAIQGTTVAQLAVAWLSVQAVGRFGASIENVTIPALTPEAIGCFPAPVLHISVATLAPKRAGTVHFRLLATEALIKPPLLLREWSTLDGIGPLLSKHPGIIHAALIGNSSHVAV
jgi:hypothetical protein